MLGGVFFYSYTIGTITSVLGQIEKRKSKLESKILVLQDIAKKYKLNTNFYKKLKSDLEYDQSKISKERNNLIANLPKKLATKLNYIINQKFIEKNKFFFDRPVEFITAVLRFLRPLRLKPKEVVYRKGDYSDELFFIMSGEIVSFATYKTVDVPFEELVEGDYFGDIEIFFSDLRESSAKAVKKSEILALYRDDLFNNVLQNFELLKIPLIFQAKFRKEKLLKKKNEALAEHMSTKYIINDIAPSIEGSEDVSTEVSLFKRKFNKLKTTLSPAMRILLDPEPSQNLDNIKSELKILKERFKSIEKFYDQQQESDNSIKTEVQDEGITI